MGHASVQNETPFVAEALFVVDEQGRPCLVAVVKATFDIRHPALHVAEQQTPLKPAGEYWGDDPAASSPKYEPEVAPFKPRTDVVVLAHAHALRAGTTVTDVEFRLGRLRKVARVFGDRAWVTNAGSKVVSQPRPFERIPLVYERAFGGWDRRHPSPSHHECDLRNPVGRGFAGRHLPVRDPLPAPNIEDPNLPFERARAPFAPVGFGFTAPHWHPRATLAGTFDERWEKSRRPLVPEDFNPLFFNAASEGLVAPGYLNGNEEVHATHMTPEGRTAFALPGLAPPRVRAAINRRVDAEIATSLDTVIVNLDDRKLFLFWRGSVALPHGPHDVSAIEFTMPAAGGLRPGAPVARAS